MEDTFQADLVKLQELLADSSLSPEMQQIYLNKIKAQGYLDYDTKMELIDVLEESNVLLEDTKEAITEEGLKAFSNQISEMDKNIDEAMEDDRQIMEMEEKEEGYLKEVEEILALPISEEEKNQKIEELKKRVIGA